jgi:hypothetical protein
LPPMHAGAICFAHTDEDVDQILKTADKVMGEMNKQ